MLFISICGQSVTNLFSKNTFKGCSWGLLIGIGGHEVGTNKEFHVDGDCRNGCLVTVNMELGINESDNVLEKN